VVDDFEYPSERFQLQPGDSLLVFTDGVTEAMDMKEEMYGFDRVSAYFTSIEADASAKSTVDGLYGDIGQYVGDAPPWDDITIMSLRYKGTG
jgi:serine phosphatase RsbU (regulator of sigma subunit)